MTVTPRNQPRLLPVVGTAMAIVVATLLANRLATMQSQPRPQFASQTTIGIATEKSMPMPKERVRYQATIENWRRYRASNPPD